MRERTEAMTVKGQPLTLIGPEKVVGDSAPAFKVVDHELKDVYFESFADHVYLISVVPSLDTEVCEMQTRRFNQEAASLSDEVMILTISMDLPFAQKRFCTTAGIDRVKVYSDHKQASFGEAYGILIKELRLLGRGIFIIDKQGFIRYLQYVREMSEHPDYEAALRAVRGLL